MSEARSPLTGSDNYIRNGTSPQTVNFNISGNGTVGTLTATNAAIGGSPTGTTLTVTGTQPPPSSNSGTSAPFVLRVVGAKGGNTTGNAQGGTGGSVLIQAGDGGDSTQAFAGLGGSITLR